MAVNLAIPYNDLPMLPSQGDWETKEVLKKCISARAILGELKQAVNFLPNPEILINTVPVLEAQASSAIENIVTTVDKLFRVSATTETKTDPATKEALRYRIALRKGYESLKNRPISKSTAIEICTTIHGYDAKVRKTPGTYLKNSQGQAIYTPPAGEQNILSLLDNWEEFLHNTDKQIDPLIKMAVAHYQFEAIHPFSDGNGRTGRIINLLYLVEQGLLNQPILYLSKSILMYKNEYYQGLQMVTNQNDWNQWILFMLKAVEESASWTLAHIDMILKLMHITEKYLSKKISSSITANLLKVLFIQPYCRIKDIMDITGYSRITATKYLRLLCELKVLTEQKEGRDLLYVHTKYLQLLLDDNHEVTNYDAINLYV